MCFDSFTDILPSSGRDLEIIFSLSLEKHFLSVYFSPLKLVRMLLPFSFFPPQSRRHLNLIFLLYSTLKRDFLHCLTILKFYLCVPTSYKDTGWCFHVFISVKCGDFLLPDDKKTLHYRLECFIGRIKTYLIQIGGSCRPLSQLHSFRTAAVTGQSGSLIAYMIKYIYDTSKLHHVLLL